MSLFNQLHSENNHFRPFKKGDRLYNPIYFTYKDSEKIYFIFSTSRCKNLKLCTLTIDKAKTNSKDIAKLENILKSFTWNLTGSCLKTNKNGVSYTFNSILNLYSLTIKYTLSYPKNPKDYLAKILNSVKNKIS